MKKLKVFIIILIISIINTSCNKGKINKDAILDKTTLAHILADINLESVMKAEAYTKKTNNLTNTSDVNVTQLDDRDLDAIYARYNTDKFVVYKTYNYYFNGGNTQKLNILKDIYNEAKDILIKKERVQSNLRQPLNKQK